MFRVNEIEEKNAASSRLETKLRYAGICYS